MPGVVNLPADAARRLVHVFFRLHGLPVPCAKDLRLRRPPIEQNPTDEPLSISVRVTVYAVQRIDLGFVSAAGFAREDGRDLMSRFKKVIVWWLLAACLCGSALMGCHTMKGAGKDIESAGEGIQRAVD